MTQQQSTCRMFCTVIFGILAFVVASSSIALSAVSMVYNLRMSELIRRQRQVTPRKSWRSGLSTATLFNQYGKLCDGTNTIAVGELLTSILPIKSFYLKSDLGFGGVHSAQPWSRSHFSNIQLDDIMLTVGYNHQFTDRCTGSVSCLVGVPAHKDEILQGAQFGFAHEGIGAQIDGSWIYSPERAQSIHFATRLVRFASRDTLGCIGTMRACFDFHLGHLIDVLIAHRTKLSSQQSVEFGYNPTWLTGARMDAQFCDFRFPIAGVRSNFYGSYSHFFWIEDSPCSFTAAVSCGFDHSFKRNNVLFASKHNIALWANFAVNF